MTSPSAAVTTSSLPPAPQLFSDLDAAPMSRSIFSQSHPPPSSTQQQQAQQLHIPQPLTQFAAPHFYSSAATAAAAASSTNNSSPAPFHPSSRSRSTSGGDDLLDLPLVSPPCSKKLKSFHSSPGPSARRLCEIPPPTLSPATKPRVNLSIDPASPALHGSNASLPPIYATTTSQTPDGRGGSFSQKSWSAAAASASNPPNVIPNHAVNTRCRPASTIFNSSNNTLDDTSDTDEEGESTSNTPSAHLPRNLGCTATPDDMYRELLPTVRGTQFISCETVMELLRGSPTVGNNPNAPYAHLYDRVVIVDCRFPYEYAGGHIKGAVNLYKESQVFDYFLLDPPASMALGQRICIVFHCEFSQQRGPHLFKRLRRRDRDTHGLKEQWFQLYYPEMYVLEGGYKEFHKLYGPSVNSTSNTPTPNRQTPRSGLDRVSSPAMFTNHQTSGALSGSGLPESSNLSHSVSSPPLGARTFSAAARFQSIAAANGGGGGSGSGSNGGLNSGVASSLASPASTATNTSQLGSSQIWPTPSPNGMISPNLSRSFSGAASPSVAMDGLTIDSSTKSSSSSRPYVISRSGCSSEGDSSLFEPAGGYVRMRDKRFASECQALMRDHECEKRMTRSQSTGALSLALGLTPPNTDPNAAAGGANGMPMGPPSATPSPAVFSRTLLSPRLDAAAAAIAANGGGHANGATSSFGPQMENPFNDLRTIRRRSLSTYQRIPTPNGLFENQNGNNGGELSLFSPILTARSPLLQRSFSSVDSPLMSHLLHTPSSRSNMTPSPSPMITSFSLNSPSSRAREATSYTHDSLNAALQAAAAGSANNAASSSSSTSMHISSPPLAPSQAGSSTSQTSPGAFMIQCATCGNHYHSQEYLACTNCKSLNPMTMSAYDPVASGKTSGILPPSPPTLIHSRSDFTTSFRRQLSSHRPNGCGVNLALTFGTSSSSSASPSSYLFAPAPSPTSTHSHFFMVPPPSILPCPPPSPPEQMEPAPLPSPPPLSTIEPMQCDEPASATSSTPTLPPTHNSSRSRTPASSFEPFVPEESSDLEDL